MNYNQYIYLDTTLHFPNVLNLILISGFLILAYFYLRLRFSFSERKRKYLKNLVETQTTELINEKNELMRSLKRIQEQNEEKDVLIKEVHHRVKNNLQAISSIVEMQLMSINNEEGKAVLTDTYRRIRAMSMVHERLHMTNNIAMISANHYLKHLIESINNTVNKSNLPIVFKPRICLLNLNVSDCISLGMITSEAISNSIKYAFENTEKPIIYIDLFHLPNRKNLIFRISDNGIGIAENHINGKENSLGIRLIRIFSAQLKGTLDISNNSGTEIKISFQEREYAGSNLRG